MRMIIIATVLALSACAGQPSTTEDATARIVKACMSSGLFKLVDGAVALAVPAASIPVALVNAGVDKVCTHPETAAMDIVTLEQLLRKHAR